MEWYEKEEVRIVEFTPEFSSELMKLNTRNRRLNPHSVDFAVESQTVGPHYLVGDAVVVSKTGVLLNGQHRLAAVIKSGMTVKMLLLSGAEDASQDVMDIHQKRLTGQALGMYGEKNANALASAVGWFVRYQRGSMRTAGAFRLSTPQARKVLAEHPGLRDSLQQAEHLRQHIRVMPGLWGALIYLFNQVDEADTQGFLEAIKSGVGLAETDPRYRLRELLLGEYRAARKTPPWRMAALIIKAWNAYRDGTEMKQLFFRAGGSRAEAFPVIR